MLLAIASQGILGYSSKLSPSGNLNCRRSASFAFLVLTGEDERNDKTTQARMNVIHETGLFQGRLGFSKAIVLLEEDCAEFSNIHGLTQIRFPKGNIQAKFEEIRRTLEAAGLINPVSVVR